MGQPFRRCAKCRSRLPAQKRRCACGHLKWSWGFVIDVPAQSGAARRQMRRGGFSTREEAERARLALLTDAGIRTDPAARTLTLASYLLDEWLESRRPAGPEAGRGHRGRLSAGTWASYRDDIVAHVIPNIGAIPLATLTGAQLDTLYDRLEASGGRRARGLSPHTVANVHGVLHKALADAVRHGRLARNPADAVTPPRLGRRRHAGVWSVEELRAFVEHVRHDRLFAAWLLFATTGMRRAEVAGLAWPDLDLDAAVVDITWTLGVVDSKPLWKRRPKSEAGDRRIALDPETVTALRAHRARQLEERLLAGPGWKTRASDATGAFREALVFTWPDGRLINPQRWTRWFAGHISAAGLPRQRLHDVRHAYATVGLANARGWHEVKVISQRLGHASIGITLDTYSHVLPAADAETANTLADLILGGNVADDS